MTRTARKPGARPVADRVGRRTRKIKVGFTQQQWELIDRLKAEQRWGDSREEILRNVLRDYVKQELGE